MTVVLHEARYTVIGFVKNPVTSAKYGMGNIATLYYVYRQCKLPVSMVMEELFITMEQSEILPDIFKLKTPVNYTGGAIYNDNGTIGDITGDFIGNYIDTDAGRLLTIMALSEILQEIFVGNTSNRNAGAISE